MQIQIRTCLLVRNNHMNFQEETKGARTNAPLADALSGAPRPHAANIEFEDPEDRLKFMILNDPRSANPKVFSTSEIRDWVRNKKTGVAQLADGIIKVTGELKQIGLLEEAAQDEKKPGRKKFSYTKVSYNLLSENAESERKRLLIPRNKFE